jgi:hypothetical protein
MKRSRTLPVHMVSALVLASATTFVAAPASGQDVADIDYAYLSLRGIAPEFGYFWSDRVEPTQTYGLRVDMGYAGPGLRVTPSLTYWRSRLERAEVDELADQVSDLVAARTGGPRPNLDLGTIDYQDIAIGLDAHVVWEVPFDLLTFGGLGVSAHIIDGDGIAIQGTFVEDLLDTVLPGVNLHLGAEYPVTNGMRLYSVGRYEVMPNLQYAQLRAGWQLMFGPNAPGEGRND